MQNIFSRRHVMQTMGVSFTGLATSSWMPGMAFAAAASPSTSKSVILLWLNGGPATIDLWDLKPGHDNGGPFREIATTVAGTRISEHLPNLASIASDFSIIRSMSTREGDHSRARMVSTTGYTPQGAIKFPSMGSLVAHEFDDPGLDIPSYVHIGGRPAITNGGFLGPKFAPFVVGGEPDSIGTDLQPARLQVDDLRPPAGISQRDYALRLQLRSRLRDLSSVGRGSRVVESLDSATDQALRLMRPQAASAFDLNQEDAALRDAYGRGTFAQGCLMARRLVERGVRCVEVSLDGWDTHSNNFEQVKALSQQLDRGFSMLLRDLKQRGMLGDTLVVCQGEFGRTPKINGQAGRDHWPSSWAMALAGGNIQGGRVIGSSSKDGTYVDSRPTTTGDLMATLFRGVGLDPRKQNMSNVSRPIRLADPEGNPIEELL